MGQAKGQRLILSTQPPCVLDLSVGQEEDIVQSGVVSTTPFKGRLCMIDKIDSTVGSQD